MCVHVCGCVYKRTRSLYNNMWTTHGRIASNLLQATYPFFFNVFLHLSDPLQGYYGFSNQRRVQWINLKRKKIQDGMSCSPSPKADIYFYTIPTSNHLPLFERLCWQEAHGSGCSGWFCLRKKGNVTLGLYLCGAAQLTGQGTSEGIQSRSSGTRRTSVGSLIGAQLQLEVTKPPAHPISFWLIYFTAY